MKLIIREMASHKGGSFRTHVMENMDTIKVGRGYDSDLIISDPFVCPDHIKVFFEDGNWYVQDQASINGTRGNKGQLLDSQRRVPIQSGDKFKIGHTYLKFFMPNQEVKPTKILHDNAYWVNKLDQYRMAAFLFLISIVLGAMNVLMYSVEKDVSYAELASAIVVVGVVGIVYALILSLTGLFARTHSYFLYHFSLVQIIYILSVPVGIVMAIYHFYAPTIMLPSLLDAVIIAVMAAVPIRLSLTTTLRNRTVATVVSSLLAIAIFAVSMFQLNDDGKWGRSQHNEGLIPYAKPLTEPLGIEGFLKEHDNLY